VLAASSLYVYLAHYLVFRPLDGWPLVAFLASFLAGLCYWQFARHAEHALVREGGRLRTRARMTLRRPDVMGTGGART
jgi:hypothetical protein